ncbi:MAG: excinuclease ABC subunit UvrC [Acidobacteria bacterium]|nr:excinuclease ABC subunit UvrC [Acidobacteriota bacterium]
MPIEKLKHQIARLPEQPGVYLFSNQEGATIYVGKARALRDRVRSYLHAAGTSPRHDALLQEACRLEVVVTDSVVEALALENHLIKQRMPKYNILLRDDKNYPYLKLTTEEAFPRVLVARHIERDRNFYAGPFLPASLGRKTMSLTHRLFGIRSCNEVITGGRGRPCLEYDIKRCLAPCVADLCGAEDYARAVEHTRLFLEGRTDELLGELRERMTRAADAERFEQAAQARDAIRTVETLRQRQQKMSTPELGDRDVFGVKAGPSGAIVHVFQVRGGRVIERMELATERDTGGAAGQVESDAEVLEAALLEMYDTRDPAPEVHLPVELEDASDFEVWLSDRAGRRVHIIVPKRGEKRGLLDLAARNATLGYQSRFNPTTAAHYEALETLRVVFTLPALPRRIDGFDISTIQGSETVASLVVCEDGRMKRGEYRKFRVRGAGLGIRGWGFGGEKLESDASEPRTPNPESRQQDDYAAMREVVLRRYRRVLEHGGLFPDLIVIDGGKGQLTAAYEALESLGLGNLVAVGLAKKEELVFTRDRTDAVALAPHAPARLLLQQIRDEAHRFAVTYHRTARRSRDLRSELDRVPGIGPRRRRALLTAFGSLAGVRRATREELVAVVGAKAADAVLAHFAGQ